MRPRVVFWPFLAVTAVAPIAFVLAWALGGDAGRLSVLDALFVATVLAEALALWQAVGARETFSRGDAGRRIWTFILLFLVLRLLAETRLAAIVFGFVPSYRPGAADWIFFVVVVLRYLYTASDAMQIVALVAALRAHRRAGLEFSLRKRDYAVMAVLWAMVAVTAFWPAVGFDRYLVMYWSVAVAIAAVLGSLAVAVRRDAMTLGGSLAARVWNAVAIACFARTASFVAIAVLSRVAPHGVEDFVDQLLLWVFANCWLLAAIYQRGVLARAQRLQADAGV